MKYWGPLLQLLLSFWPRGLGTLSQDMGCVLIHPCLCLLQGSHGVINLAAMGPLTIPLPPDQEPEGSVRFSPCQPFSEPANLTATDCLQVATCVTLRQADSGDLHHVAYGRHQKSEFRYNNSTEVLTVTYPAWPSSPLTTLVHFNCSSGRTLARVSLLPTHLEIFIQTPCACPDHCGLWSPEPGTLIAISFFVTLGIYLLWGVCGPCGVHTNQGSLLIPQDNSCCLGKSMEDKENIPLIVFRSQLSRSWPRSSLLCKEPAL